MSEMRLKTLSTGSNEIAHHESNSQDLRQLHFPLARGVGDCQYKNQVSFEKILMPTHDCSKIKIVNQLCSQKGNLLEKVTQIKFGDQIITIRDQYNFQVLGTRLVDESTKKRIHIFKKPLTPKEEKGETKSRLTKNLAKNFIKAFLNYLDDIKRDSNRELIDCKIKLFTNKQRFNNNFIQKVIDDEELEQYFRDFLQNHAQQWIENSKIREKKVHLDAINVFMRLKSSRKNALKPDSTNSYSNQPKQEFQPEPMNHDQSVHFNGEINSERDSVMANESDNEGLH